MQNIYSWQDAFMVGCVAEQYAFLPYETEVNLTKNSKNCL